VAIPSIDRATINAQATNIARDLDRAFLRVQQFAAWLATQPDATLITSYGYVQADLDVLRSATTDLDQLRTIYQGGAILAVAKDFRTFAKLCYAFGSI
jgi:hypothetical protein